MFLTSRSELDLSDGRTSHPLLPERAWPNYANCACRYSSLATHCSQAEAVHIQSVYRYMRGSICILESTTATSEVVYCRTPRMSTTTSVLVHRGHWRGQQGVMPTRSYASRTFAARSPLVRPLRINRHRNICIRNILKASLPSVVLVRCNASAEAGHSRLRY